jgi:hypothetical protein
MEEKLTFVDEVQVLGINLLAIVEECTIMILSYRVSVLCINFLVTVEERTLIILLCFSVLCWKSRSSKVMALQLMLCWLTVCSMKEIK